MFAHPSADVPVLTTALVRGAFEYQGQKCSAASRAYIPASIWPMVRDLLVGAVEELKMGGPEDFSNFVNAVIDRHAFESISGYIKHVESASNAKILVGGGCDDSEGYFIQPTVVVTEDPTSRTMVEEIFARC